LLPEEEKTVRNRIQKRPENVCASQAQRLQFCSDCAFSKSFSTRTDSTQPEGRRTNERLTLITRALLDHLYGLACPGLAAFSTKRSGLTRLQVKGRASIISIPPFPPPPPQHLPLHLTIRGTANGLFLSSGRHQVMEQHQPGKIPGERLVATVLRRHFNLDTNIANRQRSRDKVQPK
jgi:hypothetical protein